MSYLVQDDKRGQLAVRKIINTHFGRDANPWCLTTSRMTRVPHVFFDGEEIEKPDSSPVGKAAEAVLKYGGVKNAIEGLSRFGIGLFYRKTLDVLKSGRMTCKTKKEPKLLRKAWSYWTSYSGIPKRIAFKNGKLVAFMASSEKGGVQNPESVAEDALENVMSKYENRMRYQKETGRVANDEYYSTYKTWVRKNFKDEITREYERLISSEKPKVWWDRKNLAYPNLDFAR